MIILNLIINCLCHKFRPYPCTRLSGALSTPALTAPVDIPTFGPPSGGGYARCETPRSFPKVVARFTFRHTMLNDDAEVSEALAVEIQRGLSRR